MKISTKYILLTILIIGGLQSCASHRAKYAQNEQTQFNSPSNPYFTLYLIGDAGNSLKPTSATVLDHLSADINGTKSESAIVWLGDNIYPVGLAPEGHEDRADGYNKLMAQLNSLERYTGQVYFIPGNHDWYSYGLQGILRQENVVEETLKSHRNKSNDNFFKPDNGCGDPELITLKEGIDIVLMDSQWFLRDDNTKNVETCACNTREEFLKTLDREITRSTSSSLIVAMHHPPYTYGHHGGGFTLKDHIFPITQVVDNAYIPLPVVGSFFNWFRNIASDQDNKNPKYKKLKQQLIEYLDNRGSSLVVSGHEHNLQHIQLGMHNYIVSGAGSKNNPSKLGKGSQFCIGEKGYVKVIFSDPKHAIAEFIVPSKMTRDEHVVYSAKINF